ncbi:hypothetical protein PoMZ_01301 [Pyricularia oryzae]|uniref:Uncharacterized protein n=1 Tax=Pyricularia oryzae TaxID=318829 RepID=A0A4V1C5H4_PYROR|nr:hypothetical protein PoMZ_01301 [Pyricularia oryzae]
MRRGTAASQRPAKLFGAGWQGRQLVGMGAGLDPVEPDPKQNWQTLALPRPYVDYRYSVLLDGGSQAEAMWQRIFDAAVLTYIQQALGNVYARRGGRGMWATKVKSSRFDQQDGAIVS